MKRDDRDLDAWGLARFSLPEILFLLGLLIILVLVAVYRG